MDRRIKDILDEFLPYTDEETKMGEVSIALRNKKNALRKRLAQKIEEYKDMPDVAMPSLRIDMIEILKQMQEEN